MKKITIYLTEQEIAMMQNILNDQFKYLSMNASSHGEILALHAINHISHQLGQARGWLPNPVRKIDAKQRASTFRKINDKKVLAEINQSKINAWGTYTG